MKKQAFNPYLPSWEYIPDGEPHVFGNRVYVYGSHDLYNGTVFCLGDYVCYSAPVDDLSSWKYEGVIYKKMDDPANDGRMVLYAPDVTQGPDGRYYLYYVLDKVGFVSVAVCNKPAGKYKFYGYVHYKDGTRLGDRKGDLPQFDPGVLTEGDKTYLYTGFCGRQMKDRIGAMATVLGKDMLTIEEEPVVIAPGDVYSKYKKAGDIKTDCPYTLDSVEKWGAYKDHEFFEAPSIRKVGDTYYFVFSTAVMHELGYAVSKNPTKGFEYKGVIVSNCDIGISSYKKADLPSAHGANNHGGFVKIKDDYYIFYHRHTNNTWYSRQGCAEKIKILPDGTIPQVEITSCGLNDGPLEAKGEYPSYIVCNQFNPQKPVMYVGDAANSKVVQDGRDGDKELGYIANISQNTVLGFKYFDFKNVKKVTITVRGYIYGNFEVRTDWNGPTLGKIEVTSANFFEERSGSVNIPDGIHAFYLVFTGTGTGELKSFRFD